MTAALIGGMDRLQPHYQKAARKAGYKLKMFTGAENTIQERLGKIDMVIIFTNKVSHPARKTAMSAAKSENIPVMMCHSCGVSSLRECLENKSCPRRN